MKTLLLIFLCFSVLSITAKAQAVTQWQKLQGGSGDDRGSGFNIQQTSDGGYITAGYSYSSNTSTLTGITNNGGKDGWVKKLDANGNTQWHHSWAAMMMMDSLVLIKVLMEDLL